MSTFQLDFSFDPGKLVAFVSTLMGVAGSVNIVRLLKRVQFHNSNSKRILVGMSCCEVVSSVAFSLQSLFIPRETSHFLLAIGNGSALGLMMQLSICSFLYTCLLSFIYLSKVQNQDYNRDFVEKRIEPWTGAMGISYPILSAIIGAAMRVYSGKHFQKESDRLGRLLFPGYNLTFFLAAILVNSLVIFAFVRAGRKLPYAKKKENSSLADQTNAVATAACLLTFVWTAVLRVLESNDIRSNSEAGIFPLVLLQVFFLPALAFFNLVTWLKPRYQRVRAIYPFESSLWCVERALFGDKISPTKGWQPEPNRPDIGELSFSLRRGCQF
jgi:hypothetical protein